MGFHFLQELELRAGANQIVFRVIHLEIHVAVQIIAQEANAYFQRHQLGSHGQGQQFGFVQAAAEGFQIALRKGTVIGQAEMHLVKIGLVLQRRAGAEADGVAKVVGRQTGHHRVQIDDAQGAAGLFVHAGRC